MDMSDSLDDNDENVSSTLPSCGNYILWNIWIYNIDPPIPASVEMMKRQFGGFD